MAASTSPGLLGLALLSIHLDEGAQLVDEAGAAPGQQTPRVVELVGGGGS
jgi:hypothetical protein